MFNELIAVGTKLFMSLSAAFVNPVTSARGQQAEKVAAGVRRVCNAEHLCSGLQHELAPACMGLANAPLPPPLTVTPSSDPVTSN